MEILENLAKNAVAIGECGLDYNRMFSPKEDKKKWFQRQIEVAIKLNLPLYLHERDAHKDFIEIISKYELKGKIGIVIDDMIDTMGTMIKASETLIENGIQDLIIVATTWDIIRSSFGKN